MIMKALLLFLALAVPVSAQTAEPTPAVQPPAEEAAPPAANAADAELRRIFGPSLAIEVPGGGEATLVSAEGSADRWEVRWTVRTATTLTDLRTALAHQLMEAGNWTAKVPAGPGALREWLFKDPDQRTWNAWLDLAPEEGRTGEYRLAIRVERAEPAAP